MLSKKEYLSTIRDRISCDADGEREFDAYRGSLLLLQACWALYERKGRHLHVAPEVAGYMLENGVSQIEANKAIYG